MRNSDFEKNTLANRGSTLITVIVAIAFVTILTSIILGSSVVNIRMKSIDRQTKDDFYYAEKALNDIFAGLGQETAKIAADEYENEFKKLGKDADYELSEHAEDEYKKEFVKKTVTNLKLPEIDPDAPGAELNYANTISLLESYIVPVAGISCSVDSVKSHAFEKYDGTPSTKTDAQRIRLIGVQVSSKDGQGFQAVISTDIVIELPTMDFLSANVDVTDYSIIANKGLYINGKADINGNVYAGIHEDGDEVVALVVDDDDYLPKNLYGGINIKGAGSGKTAEFNSNYIVSKGDINLSGDHPCLRVGRAGAADANLPNIYFDTMRTCKKSDSEQAQLTKNKDAINLNANVYALNDLELNADNSKVVIKGNYYGYNDKTLPQPDPDNPKDSFESFSSKSGHDDADSSAIIINGSHSTFDMSGIRSLVLMGRAYIDFTEDGNSGESDGPVVSNVAATAEAVALKTNQQLYLVPPDLLEGPNPVISSEYGDGFKLALTDKDDPDSQKIKKWFGYTFIDPTEYYKTYRVTLADGAEVYYAFLNFNDKLWKKDDTVTLRNKENNFGYTEYSGGYLGQESSVSSMEAFFDIIMNSAADRDAIIDDEMNNGRTHNEAKKAYENQMGSTPSPHTVYSRIAASMGYKYFDLQDCVIGDASDSAIIYSQNSIVSYETEKINDHGEIKVKVDDVTKVPIFEKIEKKDNNVGMERYASYPQNLFHRYQWLATRLNAHQDIPLKTDPNGDSRYTSEITQVENEWKGSDNKGYYNDADAPPLCHFAALEKIIGKSIDTSSDRTMAVDRGLSEISYGDCIIKDGDLIIGSGGAVTVGTSIFKGVAIVNGNITVKTGTTVNGLLMATGVIILEDGVTVNYDKGLLQARIEKEMSNIRTYPESEPGGGKDASLIEAGSQKPYYLTTYLTQNRPAESTDDKYLMYKVSEGSRKKVDRIEPDYHNFMFYENWKKGPVD